MDPEASRIGEHIVAADTAPDHVRPAGDNFVAIGERRAAVGRERDPRRQKNLARA
jgi:hypothetical protein